MAQTPVSASPTTRFVVNGASRTFEGYMEGVLCRCGMYQRLRAAIKDAQAAGEAGMSTPLLSRRAFLGGAAATGAFVIGTRLVPVSVFSQDALAEGPWVPGVYLAILPDGLVQIVAHRSEMGTGIRTSLPLVVADELDADWARATIVQAIGDKKFGSQNTDGSRSINAPKDTRVHIVKSTAPPAGVGEPGVPVIAPAIANAIFAAGGKRLRELPMRKVPV